MNEGEGERDFTRYAVFSHAGARACSSGVTMATAPHLGSGSVKEQTATRTRRQGGEKGGRGIAEEGGTE